MIRGDTIAGAVEPAEQIWNTWGYHALVLLSFTLQVTLLILADVRRRRKSVVLSAVVWSAYMLADSTAVYALGHFFVSSSSTEHQLMALWAPLLLVHLGGQDNISAYAVEDNRLWLRHLQNLGVQVVAAAYVLYQSCVLSGGPVWLRAATILIFVVGVLKYGERVWALRRASSMHSGELLWLDGSEEYQERSEETVEVLQQNVQRMYHEIQMRLSKMYSIFYTKAVVMCTWQGIYIRVISLLATLAAFLLFHLLGDKDGYSRVDVVATYILLVGAGVLEITSVLRLIFSTWAMQGMLRSNRSWCKWIGLHLASVWRIIYLSMSRLNVHSLYWSGSMGQLDLWYLCSRTGDRRSSKIKRRVRWCVRWVVGFSWSTPVPAAAIMDIVMEHNPEANVYVQGYDMGCEEDIRRVIEKMRFEENTMKLRLDEGGRMQNVMETGAKERSEERERVRKEMETGMKQRLEELMKMIKRRVDKSELRFLGIRTKGFFEEIENLIRGDKLEQNILIWHIATHAYLRWYKQQQVQQDAKVDSVARATEALSNYMIFLLAAHPLHPTGSPSQRGCSLNDMMNHVEQMLADGVITRSMCQQGVLNISFATSDSDKYHIHQTIMDGIKLGESLIRMGIEYDSIKSIAQLWVHLLKTVEDQLGEDFHVKQLSNGGEFLTVLTILVKYTQPTAEWHPEFRGMHGTV